MTMMLSGNLANKKSGARDLFRRCFHFPYVLNVLFKSGAI